ncbi:MAG: MFS transporter [Clostridia bacterium]|nr:MFS transporter [Clostridia bacterium]NCC69028.1 MFS transporter [Clostridia bacterium]
MEKQDRRNKYFFGLGTVGRDMFYAFQANALLYYLSNILSLPISIFAAASLCLTVLRILDALNDPITGLIIDNIHTPWGKFKPPILVGAISSAVFFLILFADFGLKNVWFVVVLGLAYVLWDITYGINDIAYWSMLPSLTMDQKQRENFGAFARICANIGMFAIVVSWQPVTEALGNTTKAWFIVAVAVVVFMIGFQMFTLLGVREDRSRFKQEEGTSIKQMFRVLFGNDQLMWTTLSMALFMIGYCTTTGFAIYYMQYIYGDAGMYAVLAAVVGLAQMGALVIFPLFSKKYDRKQLYAFATILVVVGYIVFFFAEASIFLIAAAGVIIFVGEAFIQLLMLMFLADTIEYGQWKMGKRNESITFSIQPLINKIGGALSTGFISISLILSGIKVGDVAAESIDSSGRLLVKVAMLAIPLVFILVGYYIYRAKYKIDAKMYSEIVEDLRARGDIK